MADRTATLKKVRALLDKANSTDFPAEADSFRQKADDLMLSFAIEEHELASLDPNRARYEVRNFEMPRLADWDVTDAIVRLFSSVAAHCRCKIGTYRWDTSKVVGTPGDLDFLDMLYTSLQLQMAQQMNPGKVEGMPEGENIALLKEAGYKWADIWKILHPGEPHVRSDLMRLDSTYKKYLRQNDLERIGENPKSYRNQFIQSYTSRIRSRLAEIKRIQEEEHAGSAIVLSSMRDDLLNFFYEEFPDLRPHARDCKCSSCKTSRKPVRYVSAREQKVNYVAQERGRKAADRADLGQTGITNTRKSIQ